MKKLVVSEDTCISCGACMQIDEEHFDFSSKGTSTVKTQENLDSEALHQAIDACPVAAIRLEESDDIEATSEEATVQEETSNNDERCNCNNANNNEGCNCENCTCHNEQM